MSKDQAKLEQEAHTRELFKKARLRAAQVPDILNPIAQTKYTQNDVNAWINKRLPVTGRVFLTLWAQIVDLRAKEAKLERYLLNKEAEIKRLKKKA